MSAPHLRSVHLVEAAEAGVAWLAHVALEDLRVRLAQVHDHQAIHDIGKLAVEVEADQLASNFCILLDQNRDAFAIDFDVRDRLSEFIEIAQRGAKSTAVPMPSGSAAGRRG